MAKASVYVALLFLFLALGIALFTPNSRQILFPAPGLEIQDIQDSKMGGNSWCHLQPGVAGVRFSYGLRPGEPYPFAGLKILLQADLSEMEALEIGMKADSGAALRLALKSPAPELHRPDDPSAMFYHEVEFEPFGADTLKTIAVEEFRYPRWWRIREKWPKEQELERLSDVREIEIMNGFEQLQRDSVNAEIRSLVAVKRPWWAYKLAGGLVGIAMGIFLVGQWRSRRPKGESRRPLEGYKPTEISSVNLSDKLLQHLKEHYGNPEYSLETLAKGVGVPVRAASEALKMATGLHFKGALNEIRLTEALRLLQTGKSNISEIAFAVGFNNHAHFTRAFKAKFGKSPSEMR